MSEQKRLKIYLGGGDNNAAERLHNLHLEKTLCALGYTVILPMREFGGGRFTVEGIVAERRRGASEKQNIFVANIDGADADSGTCIEYAFALACTGRAIVYRTDSRTDIDRRLGVNAMLRAMGAEFIYEPCFFTNLDQVEAYYWELTQKIGVAIKKLSQ